MSEISYLIALLTPRQINQIYFIFNTVSHVKFQQTKDAYNLERNK